MVLCSIHRVQALNNPGGIGSVLESAIAPDLESVNVSTSSFPSDKTLSFSHRVSHVARQGRPRNRNRRWLVASELRGRQIRVSAISPVPTDTLYHNSVGAGSPDRTAAE